MLKYSRLLRPLLFLFIKSYGLGRYRWRLPLIWTFLFGVYLANYPSSVPFFGKDSINALFLSFLQLLPGFYIAALAAISTFNRKMMDKPLSGSLKTTLLSGENGSVECRELSRRRLLSHLFGYLRFVSLLLFAVCGLMQLANPIELLKALFEHFGIGNYNYLLEWFFILAIFFFFCQMMILTLFGLFYLCDRIHWKDEEQIVS